MSAPAAASPQEAAADASSKASAASTLFIPANGPVSVQTFHGYIDYYLDPEKSKSAQDMIGVNADKFIHLGGDPVNFGYTTDRIWLRFGIENLMKDNDDWRLHFQETFFQNFDVYVVHPASASSSPKIEQILSIDEDSTFGERAAVYPELVAPLRVEPGEKVTVLVSYASGGSTYMDVALGTAASFSDMAFIRIAKNFVSYGMMVILIVAATLAFCILRQRIFLAYILFVLSTLLFLMHADGIGFQYLWPQFPRFNSMGSAYFGTGVIITCVYYSREFLNTKLHHPRLNTLFLGFTFAVLAFTVAGLLINPQMLKQSLIFFALIAVILCMTAGVIAGLTRFKEVRFYLLAWAGAVTASLIMNLRHVFGFEISRDMEYNAIRMAIVFDAVMMGLAVADRYNQLRKSRQKAMEKSLADAERNLELSSRLLGLEEQYNLALDVAQSRDEELKNTVHDLRQPLNALRLNVEKLKREGPSEADDTTNITNTFTYLETLIADHLQSSVHSSKEAHNPRPAPPLTIFENTPLNMPSVLKSIHEMFLPDATEKGLKFKFIETQHNADVEPLVLMRIVTNLVANPIKYTDSGKILLLTRESKSGLRVEVHDTGIGMSEEEFERAQNREVRLPSKTKYLQDEPEGYGFGLAIARELATKHGLKLFLSSNRRQGTGVILEIPVSHL